MARARRTGASLRWDEAKESAGRRPVDDGLKRERVMPRRSGNGFFNGFLRHSAWFLRERHGWRRSDEVSGGYEGEESGGRAEETGEKARRGMSDWSVKLSTTELLETATTKLLETAESIYFKILPVSHAGLSPFRISVSSSLLSCARHLSSR